MAMKEATRVKALDLVGRAHARIQYLRGTGPNPFDYWLWADETSQLLETVFGRSAPEVSGFAEVVYEQGRTLDQRGVFDNMTLGVHGPWGIRARLGRADTYLQGLLGRLGG